MNRHVLFHSTKFNYHNRFNAKKLHCNCNGKKVIICGSIPLKIDMSMTYLTITKEKKATKYIHLWNIQGNATNQMMIYSDDNLKIRNFFHTENCILNMFIDELVTNLILMKSFALFHLSAINDSLIT